MKKTLVGAADSGNRLETLKALRHLLAERLEACDSNRDVASMSKRLMDCVAQIAELEQNDVTNKETICLDAMRQRLKVGKPPDAARL